MKSGEQHLSARSSSPTGSDCGRRTFRNRQRSFFRAWRSQKMPRRSSSSSATSMSSSTRRATPSVKARLSPSCSKRFTSSAAPRPSFTPTLQAAGQDYWSPERLTRSQLRSAGNRAPLPFSRKASCRRRYRAPTVCWFPQGPKSRWGNFSSSPSIRSADLGRLYPQAARPGLCRDHAESRRIFLEQYKLFAQAANKYGGDVRNVVLPEIGISGNTHYAMADSDITQVSRFVSRWLKEKKLD